MRMDSGVWTAHDKTITSKVTHRACGRPGSDSVAFQLLSPDGWMAPMPSQVVKLNASTPTSGMTPKQTNMASAGSAIHATASVRPAVTAAVWPTGTVDGASVV